MRWRPVEHCKVGLAEIADALARLAPADGGDAEDQVWLSSDLTALKQYCSSQALQMRQITLRPRRPALFSMEG